MARSIPFDIASTDTPAAPIATAPKRRLLLRFYDALIESQQRRAEREIARYLQRGGVKFTDQVEREIERRFLELPSERL
jgi:hypothetical protein